MDHSKALHLFACLHDGQVCFLRAPASGAIFALKREWNVFGLPAYTVIQNGLPVPGHVGLFLSKEQIIDWLLGLEETNDPTGDVTGDPHAD